MTRQRGTLVLGSITAHAPKAAAVDVAAFVANGPKASIDRRVRAHLTVDEALDFVATLLEAIERAERLDAYRTGDTPRPSTAGRNYGELFRPRTTAELEPFAARALARREERLAPPEEVAG